MNKNRINITYFTQTNSEDGILYTPPKFFINYKPDVNNKKI